jgi:CRP-like cAMP-binding protein
MLTQTACGDGSPRNLFARTAQKDVSTSFLARAGSLNSIGAPVSFPRNEQIYREREPTGCFYKVVSGTIRTCRVLIDGRRQIGGFYLPGDTFGLESGEKRAFSAEAVSDATVLVINRRPMVSLAAPDNEMLHYLWTLMRRELQLAQDHVGLLIRTAPERVASFLLEMAERIQSRDALELPMSRQDIGDYLGLTIETVSRTLTQLENASVIEIPCSKRIILRNHAVLKRLAA